MNTPSQQPENQISRRSFLKGAMAAALTAAGCDGSKSGGNGGGGGGADNNNNDDVIGSGRFEAEVTVLPRAEKSANGADLVDFLVQYGDRKPPEGTRLRATITNRDADGQNEDHVGDIVVGDGEAFSDVLNEVNSSPRIRLRLDRVTDDKDPNVLTDDELTNIVNGIRLEIDKTITVRFDVR